MTLDAYIAQIFGNSADPTKGRQMPCHPCDREHHYVVMSSCVSTQIPHAVGIAMAMKIKGERGVACFGYMGDGGTDQGKDQGETKASLHDMINVHGAGYYTSLAAGAQTVMASFNSWTFQGTAPDGTALNFTNTKMHGNKYLLTDVLKTRMGFDGLVVSEKYFEALKCLRGLFASEERILSGRGNPTPPQPQPQPPQASSHAEMVA